MAAYFAPTVSTEQIQFQTYFSFFQSICLSIFEGICESTVELFYLSFTMAVKGFFLYFVYCVELREETAVYTMVFWLLSVLDKNWPEVDP